MCELCDAGASTINWGNTLEQIGPGWWACSCAEGRALLAKVKTRQAVAVLDADIPQLYADWTLDTFKQRTAKSLEKVRAHREVCEWVDAVAGGSGQPFLLLHGPTGRGKTGLGVGALKALAQRMQLGARYVSMLDAFDELKARFNSDSEAYAAALAEVPLLFVDEVVTMVVSPWRQEVLFNLVSRRHMHKRPTIYATNMAEKLETALTDAGWRRLRDASVQVVLKGNEIDYGK